MITISTLFYGRPEISEKFLMMLKKTLQNRNDVEIIIRNNGCIDGQKSTYLVLNSGIKNLVYVPSGINVGFGQGHNYNLELARGEYFVVLNNDIFFTDSRWLDKLVRPFAENPNLKIIGLEGAPCSLSPHPDGSYIMGRPGKNLDYIEGACLAGRTEDFRKYGLFDAIYERGLFEDGSLSMRFRQMGFDLSVIRIPHHHLRGQSFSLLSHKEKHRIMNINCNIFKKRWGSYMSNRRFVNRILIKAESLGIGDILCMTPVVEAIRKNHPTAAIEVTTSYPEVFFDNPYLTELYELKREYKNAYDRIIDLRPNYASYKLIAQECEEIAAVKLDSYTPQLFLSRLEIEEGKKIVDSVRNEEDQLVIGIQTRNNRPNWQGKCYSLEHTAELIERIQGVGAAVIEFGKGIKSTGVADLDLVDKTSFREFAAIMASTDVFVGCDSLGFHVAQWAGIPSIILFGATFWGAYITDMTNVFPVFSDLECVGCYQRKGVSDINQCAIGTEECMNILPETVMKYITMNRADLLERNIVLLQKYMRNGHNK